MAVIEFVDNDQGFFDWMAQNPGGYFVNTNRGVNPSYMVLHRSGCQHTKGTPRSGNEFTNKYIKICAPAIEQLHNWVKNHGRSDGSFSKECKNCLANSLSDSATDMSRIPPAIRILPMTKDISTEFPGCTNIEDVQKTYFLDELPSREDGRYYYRKRGLNSSPGTVVLFQCQARIIASAALAGIQRFERDDENGYGGCLNFDVLSIMTFKPVTVDGIRDIWPGFKGFNQSPQELNPEGYPEFYNTLENVMRPGITSTCPDPGFLPTKNHFESAYRSLTRLGRAVPVDLVLDQIEIDATNEGRSLQHGWRLITEKNVQIWVK